MIGPTVTFWMAFKNAHLLPGHGQQIWQSLNLGKVFNNNPTTQIEWAIEFPLKTCVWTQSITFVPLSKQSPAIRMPHNDWKLQSVRHEAPNYSRHIPILFYQCIYQFLRVFIFIFGSLSTLNTLLLLFYAREWPSNVSVSMLCVCTWVCVFILWSKTATKCALRVCVCLFVCWVRPVFIFIAMFVTQLIGKT